jgi:hypothetical protein
MAITTIIFLSLFATGVIGSPLTSSKDLAGDIFLAERAVGFFRQEAVALRARFDSFEGAIDFEFTNTAGEILQLLQTLQVFSLTKK